ncbi:MurR/RpiR family transcriptional regulator [Shinella sp. HZN7]|uniref:MurR/RpiR family transcriptional regulator n=1 Tax=Shinella sp. (strain HZN7) TaxID=879274 RepID=UPI0007DAB262|nr:MurR/RpiR family transcriptional regulator [Shinella sp. HZN7]ANH08178.1 DNA-binding protein [Shinella sp. HZN7]
MTPLPGFLERITAALPDLAPAERQLATFLVDFPGELASYDAQELARLADVSKATVSRFVRRLGYESYEQARRAAREEGRTGSRLYLARKEDLDAADPAAQMEEERENLEWTFRRFAPEQFDALAARLLSARKVWLVGQRISHSFATYLSWQLVKLAADVAVVPQGGETLGEHIVAMQPEDCVIVFALRRRAAGTDAVIEHIRQSGAAVALVTDESVEPRSDLGWHIVCRTQTRSPQFNHAAVLAVCHRIMVHASLRAGPDGRARLRRIEAINEAIGDL